MAKAEADLNWQWAIDYGLVWLYIYTHGQFSLSDTNVITGFMISLFLAALAPRLQTARNLTRTSDGMGYSFFFC